MARYTSTVRDQNLRPIVGALVKVLTQSGDTAVLTGDGGLPIPNPVQTDTYGGYVFNTLEGMYDLEITFGGRTVWIERNVYVGADPRAFFRGAKGDPGGNVLGIGTYLDASGLTIPVGTDRVQTTGYHATGDGGAGSYYRIGATNPSYYPASAKFKDAANQWFLLDVSGPVRIEQFGGACDCPYASFAYGKPFTATYGMPSIGTYTDNLQPYYDAEKTVNVAILMAGRNEVGSLTPIQFFRNFDTAKCYGFSDTIIPQYATCIQGTSQGGDSVKTGTTFRFPPNKHGIIINHFATQPVGYAAKGAGNSRIEGVWFQGGGGSDRTKHGIWHRSPVFVRDCVFASFPGNNTHNVGSVGLPATNLGFGLTSGTSYENVTCLAAGNWNSYVNGSDVSASVFYNLHHKGSRLGGLFDSGSFGNLYIGYQCNEYGLGQVGAVTYSGRHYQLNSPSNTLGGATTPGTNDGVWEDTGAGTVNANYPAWVSGGSYELSVPTYAGNAAIARHGYVENYYTRCVGGRLSGTMFAGRYAANISTDNADGDADLNNRNSTFRASIPPSDPLYGTLGDTVDVFTGGNFSQRNILWGWRTAVDPAGYSFAYQGKDVRFGVGLPGGGGPQAFVFLAANTSAMLGRATAQPGFAVAANFALGNANGSGDAKVHETYASGPSATGRATGEVLFNGNPTVRGSMLQTVVAGSLQPVGIVGAVAAEAQANSTATTIAGLKDDLNALLAKLRAANQMQP